MARSFLPWIDKISQNSGFGIAGLAFKGNPETSDLRGSLSIDVFTELKTRTSDKINLFDPVQKVIKTQDYAKYFFDGKWFEDFEKLIAETNVLIICNNHSFFKGLLNANKIWEINPDIEVYDFWNNLSEKLTRENLNKYKVFGKASRDG